VRIDAQAAGTGTLILAQIDGSTLIPLQAWPITVTGGADTIDAGLLGPVYPPVGSCLLWVPGTSVGLSYRSGGTSYRIAAGSDVSIGAQIACDTARDRLDRGHHRLCPARSVAAGRSGRAHCAHDLPRRARAGRDRHGLV
jgi:hypothetical protein